MNSSQKFDIRLTEHFLEDWADPPEDPLGELSHFEMGWRSFCFEYNHKVLIEIGDAQKEVFLDPDICMMMESNLPKKIAEISQGKPIEIEFGESWFTIILLPIDNKINCTWIKFGSSCWEKQFECDRAQVLDALRGFLTEVMQLAVDQGFITAEEKEEFISPAFSAGNIDAVAIAK